MMVIEPPARGAGELKKTPTCAYDFQSAKVSRRGIVSSS
jgi:hypothetical protein